MIFNVLSGMPRSGSTLMCNILSQNEALHVGSTSVLCKMINDVSASASSAEEFKSEFINNSNIAYNRLKNSTIAFMETWYKDKSNVINKSRAWTHTNDILLDLYPKAKQIVMVRDLRSIYASIEKQHKKNPMLEMHERNSKDKASVMLSPDGIIGNSAKGVEDLLRRKAKNVFFVIFEEFVNNPQEYMKRIYEFLEQPYYEHDFKNIPNKANDVDGLYYNKFPHNTGKELKVLPSEWHEYISNDLAQDIMEVYPLYNNSFGYT